ncbi:MAG: hypothetical protein PHW87_00035 [Methanothrix sp.]|nr:hypothetical protein [Methanothrix sp.]
MDIRDNSCTGSKTDNVHGPFDDIASKGIMGFLILRAGNEKSVFQVNKKMGIWEINLSTPDLKSSRCKYSWVYSLADPG